MSRCSSWPLIVSKSYFGALHDKGILAPNWQYILFWTVWSEWIQVQL